MDKKYEKQFLNTHFLSYSCRFCIQYSLKNSFKPGTLFDKALVQVQRENIKSDEVLKFGRKILLKSVCMYS